MHTTVGTCSYEWLRTIRLRMFGNEALEPRGGNEAMSRAQRGNEAMSRARRFLVVTCRTFGGLETCLNSVF